MIAHGCYLTLWVCLYIGLPDWAVVLMYATRENTSSGLDVKILSLTTIHQGYHLQVSAKICWWHALCQRASNHHANLPLEMYSFNIVTTWETLETTGADEPTLWLSPSLALGQ